MNPHSKPYITGDEARGVNGPSTYAVNEQSMGGEGAPERLDFAKLFQDSLRTGGSED